MPAIAAEVARTAASAQTWDGRTRITEGQRVPAEVGKIHLWFAADRITGLANNDPVSTWSDVSGKGRDFTAAGALRPTFITDAQNGLPCVRFGGTQYMIHAVDTDLDNELLIGSGSNYTFFAAAKITADSGVNMHVWSNYDDNGVGVQGPRAVYHRTGGCARPTRCLSQNGCS